MRVLGTILVLFTLCGCSTQRDTNCIPRTHLLEGDGVPYLWAKHAWGDAAFRMQSYPEACANIERVEVWLRYHRADPLVCAGYPPYHTCVSKGHAPHAYYVEVNLSNPQGVNAYDMLVHEFLHVLMYEAGAPSEAHHPAMWTSGKIIRRNAW